MQRTRISAVLAAVALSAALVPAVAGATPTAPPAPSIVKGVALPPTVATALTRALGAPRDVALGVGETTAVQFAFAGWNTTGLAANGAFAFSAQDGTELKVAGQITCLHADGDQAVFGGKIASSSGGADYGDLFAVGHSLEFTVENGASGGPAHTSSLTPIDGTAAATCAVLDVPFDEVTSGGVLVLDR